MKQFYKFTLLLLALIMPTVATAHDFEVDGIYYNINGNEATVTYQGTSYYSQAYSGDVVIPETVTYNGMTYTVTAIDEAAFIYCSGLTSVSIPNSVTTIGGEAFDYCTRLTSITIPSSVTSIGVGGCLCACTGLTEITVESGNPTYDSRDNCNAIIETSSNTLINGCKNTVIPNTVTSIGEFSFYELTSLTSVTIPNSITFIGDFAFSHCSGLTSVTIGNSVTTIGTQTFNGCSGLTSVMIPNSVTTIGAGAFSECFGLASVTVASDNPIYDSRDNCNAIIETASNTLIIGCQNTVIPNSVTTIGAAAFAYCSGLNSVTIPNSVTTICDNAFWGCTGLTSLTIPKSVSSIGRSVFSRCSGLTSVIVASDNPIYDSRDNCNAIIETASNTLISGCPNTIIPNSVTTIGNNAFYYCLGLTSITIPNSVTSIGNYAFYYCTDLKDVYSLIAYPDEISMGNGVFSLPPAGYSGRTLYVPSGCSWMYQEDSNWNRYFGNIVEMNTVEVDGIYYKYINEGKVAVTYGDNKYTGDINIPETISYYGITCTVTAIDRDAFYGCRGLTSVVIPNTVTTIDICAFEYCTGLTSVTIGDAVASIDAYAFSDCRALTSIFIPSSVNSIGYCAFASCSGLTSIVVANDNPTFDSRNGCNAIISTANNSLIVGCQNTVIPNTVTDIGERAFFECTNLKEIIIPNSVISFDYETFYYCTGLTSVTIGNSVTSIGMDAFEGCSGLTSIIIPNSVTTITYGAFRECTGLKNVHIPNSVTVIEGEAFTGCEALESVKIPNSVTSIGYNAFAYCTGLENVYSYITEPSSVSMGLRVFYLKSQDYTNRTLHVPTGSLTAYQGDAKWYPYFGNIVEISNAVGDVDGDGNVTIGDVTNLIDKLLNGGVSVTDYPGADVDGDGNITIGDVTRIIDMLLGK